MPENRLRPIPCPMPGLAEGAVGRPFYLAQRPNTQHHSGVRLRNQQLLTLNGAAHENADRPSLLAFVATGVGFAIAAIAVPPPAQSNAFSLNRWSFGGGGGRLGLMPRKVAIGPMTLGNMPANGVRNLIVYCSSSLLSLVTMGCPPVLLSGQRRKIKGMIKA